MISNAAKINKQSKEREKVKEKISNLNKAQMQLAMEKKKQCDAKALAIVEQLLEPNINPDWLLQNLKFIHRSHMEDVIEERAIIKLCGYVLCQKPLTIIIKQQYHISTRKNKVYDVSRRKNFCSSLCYSACNYLLEQMLISPLWLRESEEIPIFYFMSTNSKSERCTLGDEIDVIGTTLQNINIDNEKTIEQSTIIKAEEDLSCNIANSNTTNNLDISNNEINTEKDVTVQDIYVDTNIQNSVTCKVQASKTCVNEENRNCNSKEQMDNKYNKQNDSKKKNEPNIQETNIKLENLEARFAIQSEDTSHIHVHNNEDIENRNINKLCDNNDKKLQSTLEEVDHKQNNDNKTLKSSNECRKKINKLNKNKKCKKKKLDNIEQQTKTYCNLAMHVEQCIKEWVTEKTLCLLLGEANATCHLLNTFAQQDKYLQLCKKLNILQLQDEKEDYNNLTKERKPLPDLAILQEEGKKLELKVHAFYKGDMTIALPEDEESENKPDPIMPLMDIHTPYVIRRQIFLEKLDEILPNLLRVLTANTNTSKVTQYGYEGCSLIKILVSTFNLSATNIVFKTAEWTLVGLIIIKMLSLIDAQLQSLLVSKQASMYISMILMSYKLDSSYLDRFMVDVINNSEVSQLNENEK